MKSLWNGWLLIFFAVMAILGGAWILLLPSDIFYTLVLPLLFMLPVILMVHWVALELYLHN